MYNRLPTTKTTIAIDYNSKPATIADFTRKYYVYQQLIISSDQLSPSGSPYSIYGYIGAFTSLQVSFKKLVKQPKAVVSNSISEEEMFDSMIDSLIHSCLHFLCSWNALPPLLALLRIVQLWSITWTTTYSVFSSFVYFHFSHHMHNNAHMNYICHVQL